MARNRFDRRCSVCRANGRENRAIWAMQSTVVYDTHIAVKTRPTACDRCTHPSRWRDKTVVLTSSYEACQEILKGLARGYGQQIPPVVFLENPRARFLSRRASIRTLPDSVLIEAGHSLYCSEYANEWEDRQPKAGNLFKPGVELTAVIAPAARHKLLYYMQRYELRLAEAWGESPLDVFEAMGLHEEIDYSHALYLVLMSCFGHGISLQDDYSGEFDQYNTERGWNGHKALEAAPFLAEATDLRELAGYRVSLEMDKENE